MMKRLIMTTLATGLMALSASATDLSSMNDADREAFRAEVRAYLLENPEVLMEAIAVLEQRQKSNQANNDVALVTVNAGDLFEDARAWVGGNPDGDITMVEFLDYRCSFCKRAHADVAKLISGDGNIRIIVKEYPILGEQSTIASRLAIATLQIAGPDAYKQLTDALMTFNGQITRSAITHMLDKFQLDKAAILKRMDAPEVIDLIRDNRALGDRLQITGTPTFVIGDQIIRGYIPLAEMQNVVAFLRERDK